MFERLAIVGTGAIGSVIGGYLSRAGRDVTLIDTWAEHVDTMNADGLHVTAENGEFTTSVNAMHLGDVNTVIEPFDAIFLAVKSYDTVWATHFAMRYLKPTGIIISAQNGINDEVIASIVGYSREIACVITLGAGLYEPAKAIHTGDPLKLSFTLGELNGLPTDRVQALAEVMNDIGQTKVSRNIWGERWAKLAVNSMANPIAASTGLGSAAVRSTPGVNDVSVNIAAEGRQGGAGAWNTGGADQWDSGGRLPADRQRRGDGGSEVTTCGGRGTAWSGPSFNAAGRDEGAQDRD